MPFPVYIKSESIERSTDGVTSLRRFSPVDFWKALIAGEGIALLALPMLKNLSVWDFFSSNWPPLLSRLLLGAWLILFPLATAFGLYMVYLLSNRGKKEFFRIGKYGIVGILNTTLSLGVFNSLIFLSGKASGFVVDIFVTMAFVAAVTNSFFWNKYWIFDRMDRASSQAEYAKFLCISAALMLFNTGLVHLWVNELGAPAGVDANVWANIIVLLTIPISFFGNYFGYRIFVFT